MIIDCPLHDRAHDAWTGEERREDDGSYQWECAGGLLWYGDREGLKVTEDTP
jgi:hypothetical protein